jgi:hypothetical protein
VASEFINNTLYLKELKLLAKAVEKSMITTMETLQTGHISNSTALKT